MSCEDILGKAMACSVEIAAQFERQMTAREAVRQASKTQLRALRRNALKLGKDTSFSASEAAKAMGELHRAGTRLQEALDRTTPTDPADFHA